MRTLPPAAALLAALGIAGSGIAAAAAPGGPPPGTVTFVSGEASRIAGGKEERLAPGSAVEVGDTVETRKRTRLEITLRDQSVLRVGPLSRLRLGAAIFGRSLDDRRVAARLLVGEVWAKVAKAEGGEAKFEVQTANAVAGVRGTTFRVDAKADRSVVVKVYAGAVAVAGGGPIPRPAHRAPGGAPGAVEGRAGTPPAAGPGGKRRVLVPGPSEVTREQWERLVGAMMEIRVGADGRPGEPTAFALVPARADDFEAWNRERDASR